MSTGRAYQAGSIRLYRRRRKYHVLCVVWYGAVSTSILHGRASNIFQFSAEEHKDAAHQENQTQTCFCELGAIWSFPDLWPDSGGSAASSFWLFVVVRAVG